jgi:hypothetical protein
MLSLTYLNQAHLGVVTMPMVRPWPSHPVIGWSNVSHT